MDLYGGNGKAPVFKRDLLLILLSGPTDRPTTCLRGETDTANWMANEEQQQQQPPQAWTCIEDGGEGESERICGIKILRLLCRWWWWTRAIRMGRPMMTEMIKWKDTHPTKRINKQ